MAIQLDRMMRVNKASRDLLLEYGKKATEAFNATWDIRRNLEEIDIYYQREGNNGYEHTESKKLNRSGDKSRIRDFAVPIVMPQVEAAVGYLTNVFLTGYPMFPVGGPPEMEDAALQMETIFASHAKAAKWSINMLKAFRNALKFNLMALRVDWDTCASWDVKTDPTFSTTQGRPVNTTWSGNVIENIDLYNAFWDVRVHPCKVHTHGEFAGYTELLTRTKMREFLDSFQDTQVPRYHKELAWNSNYTIDPASSAIGQFYIPIVNPDALINNYKRGDMNWALWAQGLDGSSRARAGIKYNAVYSRTYLYVRLIPADFMIDTVDAKSTQIWELCIVNGSVLLYAKRRTNAHNMLPIIIGQATDDDLGYQTKSFAANVTDMQDIASAFVNMAFSSKRRLLVDRLLYDPLRIREADINSSNPAAKIPVRPSAYGKTVADAIHQLPYHDEMADRLVTESEWVVKQSNLINGQNPAQQGQFVKGNKSRREYEDVMGHSNSRNQLIGITMEHNTLADIKTVLTANTLQHQPQEEYYNSSARKMVKIDPVKLRKATLELKVSDGMLPEEKVLNTEELALAFQTMQAVPAIGQEYQVGGVFSSLMAQRGVDLKPYKKSAALRMYEQQLTAWQQAAAQAAQAKAPFSSPQPQPSPELVAEMQKQDEPKTLLSILTTATDSASGAQGA